MTEVVAAPASPGPVWVRHKIANISKDKQFVRLIGPDEDNNEYPAGSLDISQYRTGDFVLAWIEGTALKGLKFPPGMEPVDNVPVVKEPVPLKSSEVKGQVSMKSSEVVQTPATQPETNIESPKKEPMVSVTGDVSMLNEKGIKIGSHEMVYINGVDLGDIKGGSSVKAKISGNKLVEIEKIESKGIGPQNLKEDQTFLKSVHLDEDKPYVILANLKGEFKKFVEKEAFDQVREIAPGKLIRYSTDKTKAGNPIKSFWEVDETGKSVKPRGGGKGGGGYRPDPMIELIKNFSIINEAVLDKSLDLVKYGREAGWDTPRIRSEWGLILDLTTEGSTRIYQEIEKKHKYQGGQ
jgi:hypothetical protein